MANVSGVSGGGMNPRSIRPLVPMQKPTVATGFIDKPSTGGPKSGYVFELRTGSNKPQGTFDFSATKLNREPAPESESPGRAPSPDPAQPKQRPGRIDFKA